MTAYVESLVDARAPGTVTQYKNAFRIFLTWADERLTVADLSVELLRDFYRATATGLNDNARSVETRRRLVEKVENAWRWLFDSEWHPSVPRPKRIEMPRAAFTPVRAPTFQEMAACVLALPEGDYRKLGTLMYFTGLRISQVLGLVWDNVDLERGALTIPGHLGKTHAEKAGRIIPISKHLVAELTKWGVREGPIVDLDVERQVRERTVHRAWARAGVREEIHKRRPDHAFRKGLVSGLTALGVGRDAVEVYVGHKIAGTRGAYLDVAALDLPRVAALIPKIEPSNVVAMTRGEGK